MYNLQGIANNCENVSFIVDYKTHKQFKEAFNYMWKKIAKPLYVDTIDSNVEIHNQSDSWLIDTCAQCVFAVGVIWVLSRVVWKLKYSK